MISIILIGIFIQTFIINKITRFPIFLTLLISIARNLGSYLYMDIFKINDISVAYFPSIEVCKDFPIQDFRFLASFLYCKNIFLNINLINIVYGIIGSISVSLLINLGDRILKDNLILENTNNQIINSFRNDKFKLLKLFKLIIIFDPASILYTSALGKDIFLFSFGVSIIYIYLYPSIRILLFSLLTGLICLENRPYSIILYIVSALFAFLIPNIKIKNFFSNVFLKLPRFINLKIKKKSFILFLILIPILVGSSYWLLDSYLEEVKLDFLTDYINAWNTDEYGGRVGEEGNLGFRKDSPFYLKYIFFWLLPLPFIQKGLGPLAFGSSTIIYLFLVFKIFSNGIAFKKYYTKWLLSIIMIYSISFSFISYNSGITIRYKLTSCVPPLYVLFIFSNIQAVNFKNKQIKELQQSI